MVGGRVLWHAYPSEPRYSLRRVCERPWESGDGGGGPPRSARYRLTFRARRVVALAVDALIAGHPVTGMPKKPGLSISAAIEPTASSSLAESYSLSDTGSFAKENFVVGSHGITASPLAQGEVSALRLEDVAFGILIGRGASSRVYCATHRPTGKRLALKVLQADIEGSRESRHMVCLLYTSPSPRDS